MKKFFRLSIILFMFTVIFTTMVNAHPGRTDSQGGHTCRTNCEKWGLEYGEYHYHNTNKNESNTNSNSSSKPTSKPAPKAPSEPKPSYTQTDVDNGNNDGRKKGYDDGYSRNERDSTSDSSNEGYKKGYTAGYEAGYQEGLKAIQDQDRKEGKTKGEEDGRQHYRELGEKDIDENTFDSDEYKEAYLIAYHKAFEREESLHEAEINGYKLGYSLEPMTVPDEFSNDKEYIKILETQYDNGYKTRVAEENEKHLEMGKADGYELIEINTVSIDNEFIASYEDGYELGKQTRKEEVIEEGYQFAFSQIDYQEPKGVDNEELIDWYKEGYDSNITALNIKETAFESGYTSSEYYIPKEFEENEDAIALYDRLFNDGQQKRKEEQKRKNLTTTAIILPLAGIAVGGGYIYRKRRKLN